jgi:hypothetical protein
MSPPNVAVGRDFEVELLTGSVIFFRLPLHD